MNLFFPRGLRDKLSPLPVMTTDRLVMRPVTMEDAPDMFSYSRDPETSKYLLWEPHPDLRFTENHIRELLRQYRLLTFFDWALTDKESGRMIGTAGFTRILPNKRRAEISYVLSPAYHRRGLAAEAAGAVIAFGFEELNMRALYCRIMEENLASRKVAQKLGFTFAGFEKQMLRKRGRMQRIAQYSLTKETYEKAGCRE